MPTQSACFAGFAAFALLRGAVALKDRVLDEHLLDNEVSIDGLDLSAKPKKAFRQRLDNAGDVQYYGNMTMGEGANKQSMRGLLDTGSFEVLTFSRRCLGCFKAGWYEPFLSKSLKMGKRYKTHAYGSGSCLAMDGFDTVGFDDSVSSRKQGLWIAHFCTMPVLQSAQFNTIVGIGPPGEPLQTAQRRLMELQEMENSYTTKGWWIPWNIAQEKLQVMDDVSAAKGRPDLLTSLGVQTFSTCLGRGMGSPGWMIWNDQTRKNKPGVQEIPVTGNQTWSVNLESFSFGTDVVGCEPACAALVDTGTSLFALPSSMYQKLAQLVTKSKGKCDDLSTFPDLKMTLGGKQLTFPPSSYIGNYYGQMSSDVQKYFHTHKKSIGSSSGKRTVRCQLMVMDLGHAQKTTLGPLVILGMPFFREYYTTFHLGKTRAERSIFASKAGSDCQPSTGEEVAAHSQRLDYAFIPMSVNASMLRVPQPNATYL